MKKARVYSSVSEVYKEIDVQLAALRPYQTLSDTDHIRHYCTKCQKKVFEKYALIYGKSCYGKKKWICQDCSGLTRGQFDSRKRDGGRYFV